MRVLSEMYNDILTKEMKKIIEEELSEVNYYKFISEKDIKKCNNKTRFNYWLEDEKNNRKLKNNLGFGVYFIFNEKEEIVYIGEGDIRKRLRDHFHVGKVFGCNGEESTLKIKRKIYKIKYIVISNEFSDKVKYQCRYFEQASYLFFDKDNLYKYDGGKSKNMAAKN